MRVVSMHENVHRLVGKAFGRATSKSQARAKRNLKAGSESANSLRSTITVTNKGPLRAEIGSDHPGARAQELGAYITPVTKQALRYTHQGKLKFNRAAVRLRAKRFLRRAKDKWGEDMDAAIREVGR